MWMGAALTVAESDVSPRPITEDTLNRGVASALRRDCSVLGLGLFNGRPGIATDPDIVAFTTDALRNGVEGPDGCLGDLRSTSRRNSYSHRPGVRLHQFLERLFTWPEFRSLVLQACATL